MPIQHPSAEFERTLADLFAGAKWRVRTQARSGDMTPDLVATRKGQDFVVRLKIASEGRGDRLMPLLSMAILEARALALGLSKPAIPVAVVAAPHVTRGVADGIADFVKRYAPGAGAGVIDSQGLRAFAGQGLEVLNSSPSRRRAQSPKERPPHLFTDLNQWMLKVLLSRHIAEDLTGAPRGPIPNAPGLARLAGVPAMSAFRFLARLRDEGYLDDSGATLRVARRGDLLKNWLEASRRPVREYPAFWLLKQDEGSLFAAVAEYASVKRRTAIPRPRCCLGLFAAASALGLGAVRGVPPHIYLERFDAAVLRRLGLTANGIGKQPDVLIRIPSNKESIFRAAVQTDSAPATDVLQTWLDVSVHPSRGREQADLIRRNALGDLFKEG